MRKQHMPQKSWLACAISVALAAAFTVANIAAAENPQDNLTYARIKDAMRRGLVDQRILGDLKFFHDQFYDRDSGKIDLLGPCDVDTWVSAMFQNRRDAEASWVAAEDLVFQAAIDKLGLRGAAQTEFRELDKIGEDYLTGDQSQEQLFGARHPVLERIATKLNSMAQERKLRLPSFEVLGGCGTPGTSIHLIRYNIKSVPPTAKIAVLSSYNYFLCLETNIDPFDFSKCIGWTDVSNPMMGLGPYYYVAEWPDHTRTTGRIEVSSPNPALLVEIKIRK